MGDDEYLVRAKQVLADDERADDVIGRDATGVAVKADRSKTCV
jgi:hypothetical protein